MDQMKDYRKIKGNLIHKTSIINWKKVKIGSGNIIGPYVIIGENAQHPRENSDGNISIGKNNIFREFCRVNLPTKLKKKTVIKNNCYLMSSTTIDHDCHIENNVIFSNNVTLGGNVYVMKNTQFGINTCVHQNLVIGSYCMFGMGSIITKKLKSSSGYVYIGSPAKKIKKNKIGLLKFKISKSQLELENKRLKKILIKWKN